MKPTDHASNVELITTDQLTADVERGLEIYGIATGELKCDAAAAGVRRWTSLFTDNPIGGGLFTVARHGNEVVGLFALIDLEMMVDGRPIKAGKGEFWVVEPGSRSLQYKGKKLQLAIFDELRQRARDFGYDAIQSVTRHAAGFLRRDGDVLVRTVLSTFSFPPAPTGGRIMRRLRALTRPRIDKAAARLQRLAEGRASQVREIEALETEIGQLGPNGLVSSSPRFINFRFPSDHYIKLLLLGAVGSGPLLYVFSRPRRGRAVSLVHWSGFPPEFADFAGVLARVLQMIDAAGAAQLILETPVGALPASYDLEVLGFDRSERPLADCYLKDVKGSLGLKDVADWSVTHGHMGVYGYLND